MVPGFSTHKLPMYNIEQCDVQLNGLRFYAYHGVLPQERTVGGWYTVDVRLSLLADGQSLAATSSSAAAPAAAIMDDDLRATVNYAEVYALIGSVMAQPSALIEHVAGRILSGVFAEFPLVQAACVIVRKDNPPMGADCAGCSVTLSASREN